MKKVLLIIFFILFCLSPSLNSQVEIRQNKVWSLHLNIKYCGVQPFYVRSGVWNEETSKVENLNFANRNKLIFQWTWEKNPEIFSRMYRSADIISEMSNKIYYLSIIGKINNKKAIYTRKTYWISPLGLGDKPIILAPLRQFIDGNWNEDDAKALSNWYLKYHSWSSKDIWKEVKLINYKLDARSILNITIKTPGCIQV